MLKEMRGKKEEEEEVEIQVTLGDTSGQNVVEMEVEVVVIKFTICQ